MTPTLRSTGEIFDDEYYRIHCDDPAHPRSTPEWPNFFEPIADAIVLGLAPRKVFDAGCAAGFLAEKLWTVALRRMVGIFQNWRFPRCAPTSGRGAKWARSQSRSKEFTILSFA